MLNYSSTIQLLCKINVFKSLQGSLKRFNIIFLMSFNGLINWIRIQWTFKMIFLNVNKAHQQVFRMKKKLPILLFKRMARIVQCFCCAHSIYIKYKIYFKFISINHFAITFRYEIKIRWFLSSISFYYYFFDYFQKELSANI